MGKNYPKKDNLEFWELIRPRSPVFPSISSPSHLEKSATAAKFCALVLYYDPEVGKPLPSVKGRLVNLLRDLDNEFYSDNPSSAMSYFGAYEREDYTDETWQKMKPALEIADKISQEINPYCTNSEFLTFLLKASAAAAGTLGTDQAEYIIQNEHTGTLADFEPSRIGFRLKSNFLPANLDELPKASGMEEILSTQSSSQLSKDFLGFMEHWVRRYSDYMEAHPVLIHAYVRELHACLFRVSEEMSKRAIDDYDLKKGSPWVKEGDETMDIIYCSFRRIFMGVSLDELNQQFPLQSLKNRISQVKKDVGLATSKEISPHDFCRNYFYFGGIGSYKSIARYCR